MDLNGRETTGRLIAMLHRMANFYLGQELQELKIGSGQYIFLAELFDKDGQSQEELTRKVYVDKANTTRALKKLEELGYVRRIPDNKDQRIKRVFLQPSALEIEEKFWRILTRWSEIINQSFSRKRQDELTRDLNKMAENAAAYLKRY